MQKAAFLVLIAFLAVSCNQPSREKNSSESTEVVKIVSASIQELLATPADYDGKEVAVSGMVTHVCRHGGQKCFIVAEDGETQIRIVPGGDIAEFLVEMEGSTIAFKGVFNVLNPVEAEELVVDHESKEHHVVEQSHSEAEKADYFVEAIEFKEVTP
jgi:cytochrome c-type biogenesis protein CcmE